MRAMTTASRSIPALRGSVKGPYCQPGRYVARFTEGVALMTALRTRERVRFPGEFWQLEDASMEPQPFQKPYPPLWFGASGPAALRGAVRARDGWGGWGGRRWRGRGAAAAGSCARLPLRAGN